MQDLATKSTGSLLYAGDWNQAAAEVQNFITSSGDPLSSSTSQLVKTFAEMSNSCDWYTVSGDTNNWVLTGVGNRPFITQLPIGLRIRFRVPTNNTSPTVTLNVQGTGVYPVHRASGSATLQPGDMSSVEDNHVRWSGSAWVLEREYVGTPPIIGSGKLHPLARNGLIHSTVSQFDGTFETTIGSARNWVDTEDLFLTSTLIKDLRDPWVAGGGGVGAKPAGVLFLNNTWYRKFIVGKPDGTTDITIDTSQFATNFFNDATAISAGYTDNTLYRRIGWIRIQAASQERALFQSSANLNWYTWETTDFEQNFGISDSAREYIDYTEQAPPNTIINLSVNYQPSLQGRYMTMSTIEQADTPVASGLGTPYTMAVDGPVSIGSRRAGIHGNWEVDGESKLWFRSDDDSAGGPAARISTTIHGFYDPCFVP